MSRFLLAGLFLLLLIGPLEGQSKLPLVDDADYNRLRDHCRHLLKSLETLKAALPADTKRALQELLREKQGDPAAAAEKIQKLLDPHCLIGVSINPESRVKAARAAAAAELRRGRESVMLIKVHNDAGVTNKLTVTSPQMRAAEESDAGHWLEAVVQLDRLRAKTLSGDKLEYVILRLNAHEAGKREATLKFDVGQGTQDLGFRAEVPVLFTIRSDAP